MRKICNMLRSQGIVEEWEYERVLESYKGARRSRYMRAYEELGVIPNDSKSAKLSCFVKAEKADFSGEKLPDPRIIVARKPKWNLEIAKWIKPIEKRAFSLLHRQGGSATRVIVKGLNPDKRAALIRKKWDKFKEPVVVSVDASRFDKHVEKYQLLATHAVYKSLCPDRRFSWMLSKMINSKGKFRSGLSFVINGKRCTGDMDTALGNTLIMVCMVMTAFKMMSIRKFDIACDGDDCLLFMERKDLSQVLERLPTIFRCFGHKIKMEGIYHRFCDVTHCQCRPCIGARGWTMVRSWIKAISILGSHKHFHSPLGGLRALRSIALCERHINNGIPILGEWANMMLRHTSGVKAIALEHMDDQRYLLESVGTLDIATLEREQTVKPTLESYLSFCDAFGISLCRVRALEAELRTVDFPNLYKFQSREEVFVGKRRHYIFDDP